MQESSLNGRPANILKNNYSAEIWKRFRKWGGIPTGATQNPKDPLSSPEIKKHLGEQRLHLYAQPGGGRPENTGGTAENFVGTARICNQLRAGSRATGLQQCHSDDFPKDTELYKLLTTKPSEMEHKTS